MKTIKLSFPFLLIVVTISVSSVLLAQQKERKAWNIPANFKDMKNEVKVSPESIQAGGTLYKKHCASCHGKTGLGDGPKAKTLETFSGDFTSADFQNQSDGTLFYQTKFGRNEMPKYDKKIEDTDIWNIVNYMRTFKK